MKTTGLFLFGAAFLFVGTSGLFRFLGHDLERSAEYEESDLKTMLGLISDDLRLGRRVMIDAPSEFLEIQDETMFQFDTELRDQNNNWIDASVEVPPHYAINGSVWSMAVEQQMFHVVALNTSEVVREDGTSSLRFNITVWVEDLDFSGRSIMNGTWGRSDIHFSRVFFSALFEMVQVRFELEFELRNGEGRQSRNWYVGPMHADQATMTVTNVTTSALRSSNSEDITQDFEWLRDSEDDDSSVDEFARRVMMLTATDTITAFGGLLRRALGERPYSAPSITRAALGADASGYQCMAPSLRRSQ